MTTIDRTLSGRSMCVPRGLVLDFGGVVATTESRPGWQGEFAAHVLERLEAAGVASGLDLERIGADITAGAQADKSWKRSQSRVRRPAELTHEMFWFEFVACDWPEPARDWAKENASALCELQVTVKQDRHLRDGIRELLAAAAHHGVKVAMASNILSGTVYRRFVAESGLSEYFDAQLYSNEARARKPNPALLEMACEAIGLDVADCWYVGDNFDRDTVCGVRAGIGGNILLESEATWKLEYAISARPDLHATHLDEIREALVSALVDAPVRS